MCRKANANNLYVFPGNGECGYIVEPRKQIQLITQETGIEFTMHDLRRTFITMAEKLDISVYALKRLLNHKTEGDVTAGYIIADVERLRKPMQLISEHLCSYFKLEN
jgi:integrase